MKIEDTAKKIVIRTAGRKDLNELSIAFSTIFSEKPYSERWSRLRMRARILAYLKKDFFFVAIADKKIVGFIVANLFDYWDGKRAYIAELGVLKEFRSFGVGTKLVHLIEKRFTKENVTLIEVNADLGDPNAVRFYQSLGYKRTLVIELAKQLP